MNDSSHVIRRHVPPTYPGGSAPASEAGSNAVGSFHGQQVSVSKTHQPWADGPEHPQPAQKIGRRRVARRIKRSRPTSTQVSRYLKTVGGGHVARQAAWNRLLQLRGTLLRGRGVQANSRGAGISRGNGVTRRAASLRLVAAALADGDDDELPDGAGVGPAAFDAGQHSGQSRQEQSDDALAQAIAVECLPDTMQELTEFLCGARSTRELAHLLRDVPALAEDLGDLFEIIQNPTRDTSHRVANYFRKTLGLPANKELRRQMLSDIHDEEEELWLEYGDQILFRLHGAPAAAASEHRFSEPPKPVDELLDRRFELLGSTGIAHMLSSLLARVTPDDIPAELKSIEGMLAAFREGGIRFHDPVLLKAFNDFVSFAAITALLLTEARTLTKRIAILERKSGGVGASSGELADDVAPLLKGLVNVLVAIRVTALHFERLAKDLNVIADQHAIVLLAGIKGILGKLPEKVFTDLNARNTILGSAQDALDSAIDREEAAADAAADAAAEGGAS